jgi:type IV secretory pathway VirB3-like protein
MIGVVAVSYGMLKDNILIFIIGLIFVFVGYLLIRRKINCRLPAHKKKNKEIRSEKPLILSLKRYSPDMFTSIVG